MKKTAERGRRMNTHNRRSYLEPRVNESVPSSTPKVTGGCRSKHGVVKDGFCFDPRNGLCHDRDHRLANDQCYTDQDCNK